MCTCSQSWLLLKLDWSWLWEHLLSIQIFHRQRIYQADCKDLIHSLFSCMERFPFFLLSCTALGAQLWFWPQLYMWATLSHLFPRCERGQKHQLIGISYSGQWGMWWPEMGCSPSACGGSDLQGVTADWDFTLVGVLPNVCRDRSWHVEAVVALSLVNHSTMASHFLGRPCFLQGNSWPWSPLTPIPSVKSVQVTAVLSLNLFS